MKTLVLRVAQALGLFGLARRITRRRLRVLCYHSFGVDDEASFRPGLFLHPEVFEGRLRWLAQQRFAVLRLDDAIRHRRSGTLPPAAVVITIDDGMTGVCRFAGPCLARHGMPATLYLTTYHQQTQTPVFDVSVGYMVWKTSSETLDPNALPFNIAGHDSHEALVLDEAGRHALEHAACEYGRNLCEQEQEAICTTLGQLLKVDYAKLCERRVFTIVNDQEAQSLQRAGVDLQLHTHHHQFPADAQIASRELELNSQHIVALGAAPPRHFCYPSGEWEPAHLPLLEKANVMSATTCDTGLVTPDTPVLAMNRILDSSRVSQIEFEAEMTGFLDLLRDLRSVLSWLKSGRSPVKIS